MTDNLITLTDAKQNYGATKKDLVGLEPVRSYWHKRNKCQVSLFTITAVEAQLVDKYGSLELCLDRAKQRRAAAQVHTDRRRAAEQALAVTPPEGWPDVGRLHGADRWAAVDVETTGLNPADGCRVVEVAVVIVEDGVVVREWCSRVNPGPAASWEWGAIEATGINPADVATAPAAAEVWREFAELTAGLKLAAHNASFDMEFIAAELGREGLSHPWISWHCTLEAATGGRGRSNQWESSRRRWVSTDELFWKYARRHLIGEYSALADAKAVAWLAPRLIR